MNKSLYISWACASEIDNSTHPRREKLLVELRQRNHICLNARWGGAQGPVVGLLSYRVYTDKIRISSLYVEEEYRRRGIATALLAHLFGKLERHPTRESIRFNVCERETDMHHFLKDIGFRAETVIHSEPARYLFAFYQEQIETLETPEVTAV